MSLLPESAVNIAAAPSVGIRNPANGGKMHYWRCPTSGDCVTTGIRENRFKELTSSVMGLAKHDAEAFKKQIEYISVADGMMLTFH